MIKTYVKEAILFRMIEHIPIETFMMEI